MSNFEFLQEWPQLHEHAVIAEQQVNAEPRSSCFYSRYTLERTVKWMFEFDSWLQEPKYDNSLNTLINDPEFKRSLGSNVFPKIKAVQRAGNNAVHSERKVSAAESIQTLKELHHFLYWFYRTYTSNKPPTDQLFDTAKIPNTVQVDANLVMNSAKQLKALQKQLSERDESHKEQHEKLLAENLNWTGIAKLA